MVNRSVSRRGNGGRLSQFRDCCSNCGLLGVSSYLRYLLRHLLPLESVDPVVIINDTTAIAMVIINFSVAACKGHSLLYIADQRN
jgi:hypothetical protein